MQDDDEPRCRTYSQGIRTVIRMLGEKLLKITEKGERLFSNTIPSLHAVSWKTVHCVEERGVLVNFQLPVTNFLVKEIIKINLYFYPWLNSAFVQRCKKKQYLTYVHFPEGFQGIWFYWMKQDIWKGKIHGVI